MITILRYPNRKLYYKDESRYTSIVEVGTLATSPAAETGLAVIDWKSGKDITREILARSLAERIVSNPPFVSDTLHALQKGIAQ